MITIGVPTLNGPDRLFRCLRSIAECTNLEGVRVLVCDDGSTPDNLKFNKDTIHNFSPEIPGLEMLMNGGRFGIAKSWNLLTRHYADAKIIVLLNDDVEVVDYWLDVLRYSLEANPCAGMVGLNSYIALMKDQHASLHPNALPHERLPLVDYREAKLLDGDGSILSAQGPIFAFRKDVFDLVGGFDERYFVYYEELDFAVSLRKNGLFSFVTSYPMTYHMGGATNSDTRNLVASDHMARSRRLFIEKWGKTPAELREEFFADYKRPRLREWTSQIQNWK